MAKTVKVQFKKIAAVHKVTVRIDDSRLGLDGGGNGSKSGVAAGEHYLQWLGTGPPGVECTISITGPPESKWSRRFKVGGDGLFGGSKKFRVNQS